MQTWTVPLSRQSDDLVLAEAPSSPSHSRIGRRMSFTGDVHTASGCEVFGRFEGSITPTHDDQIGVHAHAGSTFIGRLQASRAVIAGDFRGEVDVATGVAEILPTARVVGSIKYRSISVSSDCVDLDLLKT
ncbi:MAG: polymer-forming cytoskeletal protein [Hydrogenophaga sp.]|nr:polymer-forming cytoskeletal protein [Hydrogenophaga sp.]